MESSTRTAGTICIAALATGIAMVALVSVLLRPKPAPIAHVRPHRIDVNTASTDELELLPSVGPALAAKIVADRTARGPFARVKDLDRVPGIGPAILDDITPYVAIGTAPR